LNLVSKISKVILTLLTFSAKVEKAPSLDKGRNFYIF